MQNRIARRKRQRERRGLAEKNAETMTGKIVQKSTAKAASKHVSFYNEVIASEVLCNSMS